MAQFEAGVISLSDHRQWGTSERENVYVRHGQKFPTLVLRSLERNLTRQRRLTAVAQPAAVQSWLADYGQLMNSIIMRADTDFISYIRALCTRKVRFVLEAPKLGLSELRITLPSISSIDALFDTHPRVSPHLQCSLTSALSHHVLTHDPQLLPSPSLRRSPRHHGLLRDPAHLRRGPGPGPCPRRLPRRRSGRRHGAAHPRASHPAGLLHRRRRHRFRLHRRPARRARHRLAAAQHADAAVHEQQQHFGRRRRHGRGRGRGARWLGWRRRPRGRRHRAARGAGPGRRGGPAAAGPQGREPARVPGQDGRVRADRECPPSPCTAERSMRSAPRNNPPTNGTVPAGRQKAHARRARSPTP